MESSNVKVNIVELASNLAHNAARDEMFEKNMIGGEDDMVIGEDILTYTEEAQNIFDRWYDYFYDEILKVKI